MLAVYLLVALGCLSATRTAGFGGGLAAALPLVWLARRLTTSRAAELDYPSLAWTLFLAITLGTTAGVILRDAARWEKGLVLDNLSTAEAVTRQDALFLQLKRVHTMPEKGGSATTTTRHKNQTSSTIYTVIPVVGPDWSAREPVQVWSLTSPQRAWARIEPSSSGLEQAIQDAERKQGVRAAQPHIFVSWVDSPQEAVRARRRGAAENLLIGAALILGWALIAAGWRQTKQS